MYKNKELFDVGLVQSRLERSLFNLTSNEKKFFKKSNIRCWMRGVQKGRSKCKTSGGAKIQYKMKFIVFRQKQALCVTITRNNSKILCDGYNTKERARGKSNNCELAQQKKKIHLPRFL